MLSEEMAKARMKEGQATQKPTMADVAGPARTGMEEVWATRMLGQDPITGESFSQDRPFGEVVPDFDKYGNTQELIHIYQNQEQQD